MSKIQLVYNLSNKEILHLYQKVNSISKILTHLKIKGDPRCRRIISQKLTQLLGTNAHSIKYRTKQEYSIESIRQLASTVDSVTKLLHLLKLQPVGGNFGHLRDLLVKNDIHLAPKQLHPTWPDTKVYCKNSTFDRRGLARRVKKDNWLSYKCLECKNKGQWNDKPLHLHLDHKNGCNVDHRKQNLQWLCPNCHSQTPTYGGRNNKR